MNVNSVSAQTSAATGVAKTNLVDYNAFLKLLVAQAQNQDPTNPKDSTEYLSQLASFSAVEQQTQTNAKLDTLLAAQRLSQADGLIGRTLGSADGVTRGVVASVTLSAQGLHATLRDGRTLVIGDGVTVS